MRCRFFASFIFTFVLYLNDAWLRSRASFKKFACDSDEREKNNHCLSFASGYLWGLSIFNLKMNNNNNKNQQQYKIFELWFNEVIWLQVNSQNIVAFSVKIRDWWAIIELNGMVEISAESQPFKCIFQPGPFDGLLMIISIVILKLKRNESQPPNVKTRYRDINGIDMKLSVSDFVAWWSAYELKQQSQA